MKSTIWAALALAAMVLSNPRAAQADDIQTGWAAWFNTTKLSQGWTLTSDVQLRSSDDWEDVRNVLLRAGLTRAWGPNATLTGGYAYIDTLNAPGPDLTEHRFWQQLVLNRKFAGNPLTHRFRLEQRFIDRPGGADFYSDRVRYFTRLIVPFAKRDDGSFTGTFVALQNEVFLNLSNRERLNGKLFDQNRAYVAIGRRIDAGLDLEIGYMNQYLAGRTRDTDNHVIQLAVYTRR